jgi:cobalt-zinc-cadmium efflux system membrane fusion protein
MVHVINADGVHAADASLTYVAPVGSPASQSVLARSVLPNPEGHWTPGLLVTGEVTVSRRQVPLAVQTDAMQAFREWTVVFAKVGNVYEVRMLDIGARDEDHVEVLDGIKPGTEYVTMNSYLIKADLLKSGAAHAH